MARLLANIASSMLFQLEQVASSAEFQRRHLRAENLGLRLSAIIIL